MASRIDFWRGYGSGAFVDSSGEEVLFDLVRKRSANANEIVIFDVGANEGDFAGAALDSLGSAIRIHAFEPAKETFQTLSERLATNRQVVLNHVALGRENGSKPLFGVARYSGLASLVQRTLSDGESATFQENVNVVRLVDYCASAKIERMNLLKLDVEGMELDVLSGAEALFERKAVDLCSFEFGGCNLDSRTYLRDFFQFFDRHEMDIFRITPAATLVPLPRHAEQLEKFSTTNYVAMRRRLSA